MRLKSLILAVSLSLGCAAGNGNQKSAAAVVSDIGKCFVGAESSDPALVRWLGSLFSRPDGATVVSSLLTGPGAQLIACGAAELATMGRADGPKADNGVFDRGDTIYRRADECLSGPCERVELRAARLLREMQKKGVLRLPPSGTGHNLRRVQHRG